MTVPLQPAHDAADGGEQQAEPTAEPEVYVDHLGAQRVALKPRAYQQDLIDLACANNVSAARGGCCGHVGGCGDCSTTQWVQHRPSVRSRHQPPAATWPLDASHC
jgi:hypothetical protein